MAHWQEPSKTSEWYTPKYIFDALGCTFDLDVAAARYGKGHVPARGYQYADGLDSDWSEEGGFVWMNPPFGTRNGIEPWLRKFVEHGNGIALHPDRTSAPWYQRHIPKMDLQLFIGPKVKFERPDGNPGSSPGDGTVLSAMGPRGVEALTRAARAGLGFLAQPVHPDDLNA